MDLLPSFAAMLNLPQPASQALDGMNVLPYFLGQTSTTLRDHILTACSYQNAYRYSYRLGDWKIIAADPSRANSGNIGNYSVVELYNMATDPYEASNLVAEPAYSATVATVFASLSEKISSGRSTPPQDADGDGLFDDWELATAGDLATWDATILASTADSDGDGASDSAEYTRRSNPAVPDPETFRGTVFFANDQLVLQWNSVPGLFYSLDHSFNLSGWSTFPGLFPGTGDPLQLELPAPEPPSPDFYRLAIRP
jgi:hypothetical protein